jgi:hypothetical protein
MNACVAYCTTERQNAHGTEVVVCYPWHPWHGLTVRQVRVVSKRSGTVLHVSCDREKRSRLREIPAWMVDAAACAAMRLCELPLVDCGSLRLLRELLESCVNETRKGVVKNQHPDSSRKGDADANTPMPRSSCSTRSISTAADEASVEYATEGGPATRSANARATAQRTSRRSPGERRSKGGDQ